MATIDGSLPVAIASDQVVPVSAQALPLPAGASTEATAAAASAKLPATLGQKAMAAALAVSVASDQSSLPTTEARLPTALGQGLMAASLSVTVASNQSAVPTADSKLPAALGQTTMAASLPVVLPSNQSAIPVTATQLPAALGQGTMAQSMTVAVASNQSTLPTNVATWIGSATPTVGQKAIAASLPVTIASDQPASNVPTYSAFFINATPAPTCTDFFTLVGSASKTVRVTRIWLTGFATAVAWLDVFLVMRTAANTGGTLATAPTRVPHASANAAVTATANLYSANPTGLGASAGNDRFTKLPCLTTTAVPFNAEYVWDFRGPANQPLVLSGIAQCVAIFLNGATLPAGLALSGGVEWTEQ